MRKVIQMMGRIDRPIMGQLNPFMSQAGSAYGYVLPEHYSTSGGMVPATNPYGEVYSLPVDMEPISEPYPVTPYITASATTNMQQWLPLAIGVAAIAVGIWWWQNR